MSNNSDNAFTRFLSGKGFYAVLAVCLAGAAAGAWLASGSPVNEPEIPVQPDQTNVAQRPSSEAQWGYPRLEQANQSQQDVPVEPSAPKSSSEASRPAAAGQPDVPVGEKAQPAPAAFILPIDGEILADYSKGELVKNETLGDWRTHNGIDIKAAEGTEVRAVTNGKVLSVKNDPLWGFMVEVDHANGLIGVYCGLDKDIPVRKGVELGVGAVVGRVGQIPAESLMETHLHFELKKNGKWVDPLTTMNKRG